MAHTITISGFYPDTDRLTDRLMIAGYPFTAGDGRYRVMTTVDDPIDPLLAARHLQMWICQQTDGDTIASTTITRAGLEEGPNTPAEPAAPAPAVKLELVGVSELAGLLGVSRQRASVVAKEDDAPKPLAQLASGPVWNLDDWRPKLPIDRN